MLQAEPTPTFAAAIKQELRGRRWSQKKFAAFLGKDESTVSLWLAGRHGPRLDDTLTLQKLAEFLHTDLTAVEQLLALHKAQGEPEPQPGEVRRITSLPELRRVLTEELQHFEQTIPLYTHTPVAAVQDKLLEEGYAVDEALLTKFLSALESWEAKQHALIRGKQHSTQHDLALRHFSETIPEAQLLDRLQQDFRGDIWFRDTIRQLCSRLNAAFSDTTEEALPVHVLSALLAESLPNQLGQTYDNILKALLQACTTLGLLVINGEGIIQRRWRLSPEFIINRLFGINLHMPGLDFLLDGGLLPPTTAGMTMLIKGRAGTGKTMLALQVAASMAAQGHVAVYLSAEEDPNLLRERLSYIGYAQTSQDAYRQVLKRDGQTLLLLASSAIEPGFGSDMIHQLRHVGRGTLLLVTLPNRAVLQSRKSRLLGQLSQLLQALPRREGYTCYVLDSLDAVYENGGRRLYEEVFNFARHRMSLGLFIAEAPQPEDAPLLQDYLVDMVIKVSYRRRMATFTERILEIEKCRTQNHIRGEHMFSIHSGEGITVYPSVQALLSVWRRRIRRAQLGVPESWSLDSDFDFDRVLRGDVVQGSTILLSGTPATRKLPLGLAFLASGLRARPETQVLLISLREDAASLLRMIHTYPQFHDLLDSQTAALSPHLTVLHFPPDYFTAERFLHWIQQTLQQLQRSQRVVSRALFSNLSQLGYNSPMFPEERLFIAALIELFKKEDITSLFIDVGSNQDIEIHNIFDTLLFTHRDVRNGTDRVLLTVSHSGPGNADRTPQELDRRAEHDYGRLVLRELT